jgi:tRNA A-37 threonylcarbamoyl transferase component Bud32
MQIRCPHCHSSVEIADDDHSLSDIPCPTCGSSFSLVPDPTMDANQEQAKLGHFQLVERIGVGTFGSVWRARDTELDRWVAIKIPRKDHLDAEEAEKFVREARAAAQINHPNIVSVFEVGRDGNRIYLVSDFIDGVNLADRLSGKAYSASEAAELTIKLADALHHAHECGVIHRDLKPSNVMLDRHGEPHIMDFGLAKREAGEVTVTMDGRVLGTPAYMSPEQALGAAHESDRRTDVYSLGVILFELLTGELPFRGNARMLLHQVINDDPPAPRRLNSSIPRDLETIALKCMEKDPRRRYSTARDMADELRRFLNSEPIHARPIGAGGRVGRWCRRNPIVAGLAAAVLLTLAAGLATTTYFAVQSQQRAQLAEREKQRANTKAREAEASARLAQRRADEALAAKRIAELGLTHAQVALDAINKVTSQEFADKFIPRIWRWAAAPLMAEFEKTRKEALLATSSNNLLRIGSAINEYHKRYGHYPPAAILGPDGEPWHSWRVLLLPFLGEEERRLFGAYHFDEPWDGPRNQRLLHEMPSVYHNPNAEPDSHETAFLAVTGPHTALGDPQVMIEDIRRLDIDNLIARHAAELPSREKLRGRDQVTLIVGTVSPETKVAWTQPLDVRYETSIPPLGELGSFGALFDSARPLASFLLADGNVGSLPLSFSESAFRALIDVQLNVPLNLLPRDFSKPNFEPILVR